MAPDSWSFSGRTGTCTACEKQFAVGDAHYSALYEEQAELVRKDFCEACWESSRPPEHFSFWRSVVPEPEEVEKKKRRLDALLNPETLLEILKEMPDDPDPAKRRFRFVLSLMVMRRKKLKLLQIARKKSASGEGTEDFLIMQTTGRAAKQRFEIADVKMNADEMIAAQDEVGRLLALGGVDEAVAGGLGQADPESADAGPSAAATADAPRPGDPASEQPSAVPATEGDDPSTPADAAGDAQDVEAQSEDDGAQAAESLSGDTPPIGTPIDGGGGADELAGEETSTAVPTNDDTPPIGTPIADGAGLDEHAVAEKPTEEPPNDDTPSIGMPIDTGVAPDDAEGAEEKAVAGDGVAPDATEPG